MTGKKACAILEEVRITTNKNAIPNDPEKPMVTSGIRLGTPAVTSRGMGEREMKTIAKAIADVLKHPEDEDVRRQVLTTVDDLCRAFPLYESKVEAVR